MKPQAKHGKNRHVRARPGRQKGEM